MAAKSSLIVLFLLVVITANAPLSGFRKAADPVEGPILAATGARQVWNVFAPDPGQAVGKVAVRFRYRDGTSSTWRIPRGSPFVHGYSDYRWLKLAENVNRSDAAATGLLLWAAREKAEDKPLARVDLIRSVYDVAKPGDPKGETGPVDTGVLLSLQANQ